MSVDHYDIYTFGDLRKDVTVDDKIVNDNKDRNKVLATIAMIIRDFISFHPDRSVFFCGNTPAKTRLFRMALSRHIGNMKDYFSIYGVLKDKNDLAVMPFTKNI